MHEAIGDRSVSLSLRLPPFQMLNPLPDRFHAIMVDNGVLRMNEAAQVHKMLCEDLGVNLTVIDSSELFLGKLKGITDPEEKRKIIGNTFIEVFEEEAERLEKKVKDAGGEGGEIEWLLQGTLYPDVIESISFKGPSATIKTHHNVGGLLEDMKLKLIEPLRELFKGAFLPSRFFLASLTPSIRSLAHRRSPRARSSPRHPRPSRRSSPVPRSRTRDPDSRRSHGGAS
jgi:hypothetical protein